MSRQEKVAESIKKEISLILHDEFKDPRLGFVTITHVEITPDLRNAKVFYSVLGKDDDYKKTQQALESGLGFIRRLVAQRLSLRFSPELIFRQDRSLEYALRIEEVLQEIKQTDGPKKSRRLPKKAK